MTNPYTPSHAANRLGVSGNTIRRWCGQFADHLSPEASGSPRLLSDDDLVTLEYVRACREDGMPTPDIADRLGETTITAQDILVTKKDPSDERPAGATVPEAGVVLLQAHTEALQRLTLRLEYRHAEVRQLAGEVKAIRTWFLGLAAVVAVIIVAVITVWIV